MPTDPADVTNSNTDLNLSLSPQPLDYSTTNDMSNNPNAQANHFNHVNATDQDNFTYPVNLMHQPVQPNQTNQQNQESPQHNGVYPINLGGESFVSPAIKSVESNPITEQLPMESVSQEQFVAESTPVEQFQNEHHVAEQLVVEQLPLMEVSTIAPSYGDGGNSSDNSGVDTNLNSVNPSEPEVVNLQTPVVAIQDVDPDAEELTKFADEEEENLIHGISHAHGFE